MTQLAVRTFPLPERPMAEQPVIGVAPSTNATEPVGPTPLTVASSVTLLPTTDGLSELDRVTLELELVTICETAALLDPASDALPP